jgi:two-component system, cell cycle response regulator DivK
MSKRILVVEDQPDNRQIIRDMRAPTGYEITEVENGEEALVAIAKQRPDLILMDIQLPVMDGYEATRRIKADPALRSIPIIAVTSYALSGEETKARSAGCDEYVPCWRKFAISCNSSGYNCCSAGVRYWHKADMPFVLSYVRFRG